MPVETVEFAELQRRFDELKSEYVARHHLGLETDTDREQLQERKKLLQYQARLIEVAIAKAKAQDKNAIRG